jgi:Ca2+-binding RTX toxin-like protein
VRHGWVLIAAGVVGLPLVVRAPTAHASIPQCFGEQATIVGTSGPDSLSGTSGPDVIVGLGGTDTIRGGDGADRICGNGGRGFLLGGPGNDRLAGGSIQDGLEGEAGNDVLIGKGGADYLFETVGRDIMRGGAGRDNINHIRGGPATLVGGRGNDALYVDFSNQPNVLAAGWGDDYLGGAGGDDILRGGAGDDNLEGFGGNNDLLGGKGFDFSIFGRDDRARSFQVDLGAGSATGSGTDTLVGIEGVITGGGDDTLTGDGHNNVLIGLSGDDTFDGGAGEDFVGFEIAAFLRGFILEPFGPVTVDLGPGTATGHGSDTMTRIEDIAGTPKADTITGDAGPNKLLGLNGKDHLVGLDGDDFLDGGGNADTGDGGNQVVADVCVRIEVPTGCESTST